ncbi:hypothetical protein ACWDSJ_27790 [Nocardia sp. NPDC003482]
MKKLLASAAIAGAALTMCSVAPQAEAAPMQYKWFTASTCWNGDPFWGKVGNLSPGKPLCAVASLTVSGEIAYDGKHAWQQSLTCSPGAVKGFVVTIDWCGSWNNGIGPALSYMSLGANATLKQPDFTYAFGLRVNARGDGTLTLEKWGQYTK